MDDLQASPKLVAVVCRERYEQKTPGRWPLGAPIKMFWAEDNWGRGEYYKGNIWGYRSHSAGEFCQSPWATVKIAWVGEHFQNSPPEDNKMSPWELSDDEDGLWFNAAMFRH